MQIAEFQLLMKELYFKNDSKRGIHSSFLWFIEEVGELSESIRKYMAISEPDKKEVYKIEVGKEMADIIAWLASLANLLDINLEDETKQKYPNICLKCNNNPCLCEKI